jgi:hypothetical protein
MEKALLTAAVNEADLKLQQQIQYTPELHAILNVIETFIKTNNVILYGGTAINDILPSDARFYHKNGSIPDYDMYAVNAMQTAKDLADCYKQKGFMDVEAKAGVHFGTYKVFVNFIPIADITYLHRDIFTKLKQKSLAINGMRYASPEFLRMAMYLELSRPRGDVSRWDKVLIRLNLLNTHFPQTKTGTSLTTYTSTRSMMYSSNTYSTIKKFITDYKCVIIGCYAINLIKQSHKGTGRQLKYLPYFEVLSKNALIRAEKLAIILTTLNSKCILIKHAGLGEIIPVHYEIQINNQPIIFIYQTTACHSYNCIEHNSKTLYVASVETMIQLYLSFMYSPKDHHNTDLVLNIAEFLFYTQQKYRTANKGLLKRFSTKCVGEQSQLTSIRATKSAKFKTLKNNKKSLDFDKWFLNYKP